MYYSGEQMSPWESYFLLFPNFGMWTFVTLMLHEQRFLHLILIWELTNAPQVEMLPHSDFNSVWLAAFPAYESASRSCCCLLSWKCGHILILQLKMSGETLRDIYISHLKSRHIPNTNLWRPIENLFTCQDPIHRAVSTVQETVTSPAGQSTD